MSLKISDYNYHLPSNLIANRPSSVRDHCRLLTLDKSTSQLDHRHFFDLTKLLGPNDVLVLNQSKVFPARLFGRKASGGQFEILLLHPTATSIWLAISKPRLLSGQNLIFDNRLTGTVLSSDKSTGQVEIKFNFSGAKFFQILNQIGYTPLPPYINSTDSEANLRRQYQTVFAIDTGSAAAPTAGLHFTKKLLQSLKNNGVQIESLTLHVGLGTFQNLRPENLATKTLHQEFYYIGPTTTARLRRAKKSGKRIVAVGTTVVRALESAVLLSPKNTLTSGHHSTQIFIYPPFKFQFVDALITNFHLPASSLLMLVSAFAGRHQILTAYQTAIDRQYRFFSFGDAMFIY